MFYTLENMIPINKRIAVVVSGGWDSAVLRYMPKVSVSCETKFVTPSQSLSWMVQNITQTKF